MFLGSPTGIYVGGVHRQAVDVVADVFRYLRQDALKRKFQGNLFESAVVTIPVTMRGPARAELRQAAQKAGIRIHQFIHEPLAALYGYLRSKPDFRQELANLERRLALVFDWGGGTLDLTLCQLQNGVLTQIFNAGDAEVGGDIFDDRLRQLVRQKHEAQYPKADWNKIQPSAESRLIQACEDAKILLSTDDTVTLVVRDLLAVPGAEKDLRLEVTKRELESSVQDLISQGLSKIETLIEAAGVHRGAIEFCLATGGMVSMPAIREGLREIFGMNQLRLVENAATVISEGAAWIAHNGVGLQLAKAIELLHADIAVLTEIRNRFRLAAGMVRRLLSRIWSVCYNSYVEVMEAGTNLPLASETIQSKMNMYCVNPSDGIAKFLFARPIWPGRESHGDERLPYTHLTLPLQAMLGAVFSQVWAEGKQITAVTPKDVYLPLLATLWKSSLGCPTGFEPATS